MKVSTLRQATVIQIIAESKPFLDGSFFILTTDRDMSSGVGFALYRCIRDTARLCADFWVDFRCDPHQTVRDAYADAMRAFRLAQGGFTRTVRDAFTRFQFHITDASYYFSERRWMDYAGHESAVLPGAWLLPVDTPIMPDPHLDQFPDVSWSEVVGWASAVARKLNGEY
jgi:hypothetical protein